MIRGLVLSFSAAVLFGVASVCQAIAVRRREAHAARTGGASAAQSASALVRLIADRWYLTGSTLDLIGAVGTAVALQYLPLFVVQSTIAASIAVTAVIAVPVLGLRLHRREITALVVVGIGLVLLALSSTTTPVRALTGAAPWLLLGGVAVMALIARRGLRTTSSIVMAVVCGLAFSFNGLAERTLVFPHPLWRVVGDPDFYSLIGYGVIGIAAYASAISRGKVTTVTGVTFAIETVVPSVIGLAVLGDTSRSGFALVAAAGFLATVGGAIALARIAEVA